MRITVSKDSPLAVSTETLVIGVAGPNPQKDALVSKLDKVMGGIVKRLMADESFKAKPGQTLTLLGRGSLKAKRLVLVGLGKHAPDGAALRLMAVRAARGARNRSSLALLAPSSAAESVEVLAEGITTGSYRYTRYLTGGRKPKKSLTRATILVQKRPTAALREAVARGQIVGDAVNLARDLVNCPANDLTATDLANTAAAQSRGAKISCKVLNKRAIEKLGMPLLLAVNRGSTEEPRFIHMTYKPKTRKKRIPRVVFVGKGLTFDSGGLCLKSAAGMLDMKIDMGGAAVTLGTVIAAARLGLPVEVHGVIASTDNMTGPDAYRPGDVFPSRLGKTVEIINTDAEGRLVLADALAYACELDPTYIVDHATLTGAIMTALGSFTAGLFSNDETLTGKYRKAAETTGESFWHMPLDEDLRGQLRSTIADLKHTGTPRGGAITAALFLSEFVGDQRWIHLDIAGPTYLERNHGIHPKGGTGFGIATAVEFLKGL